MKPTRLFDFLDYQLLNHPMEKAMGYRKAGDWVFYSTKQIKEIALKAASGLLELGLQAGDKVAISSYKNRPEWTIMDIAIQYAGMVSVPLYPTISPGEYEYILNEAEVKYAFVGGLDLYEKVKEAQAKVPSLKEVFNFDSVKGQSYWEDMWSDSRIEEVEKIKANIKPSDLVTIIYTSGTTGLPKGVMLTHDNIVFAVLKTIVILPEKPGIQVISFLPLCHIFERAVSFAYLCRSFSVHYAGTDNLGGEDGDLRAVKPFIFSTVPRLLEKVYEKIYNKGLELKGIKRLLFFWALKLTNDYDYDKKFTGFAGLKWKIADKLIFSKWREALGGNVEGIVTAAAPCPIKILKVFSAAGIPVREAYGLTETSPTLTVNLFEENKAMIGTVGASIEEVDIKIDVEDEDYGHGEGEIMARGRNIMLGYYKKPKETAAVFKEVDGEKWFCTGDVGKFVEGPGGKQFLKITDRKKELLKTSGGKYVAPSPIENRFKESFMIEQMMVVGDKRKFVSALIVPGINALQKWCAHKEIEWTTTPEMLKHPLVIDRFQRTIDHYNPEFSKIEQVKKFVLLDTEWEAKKTDGTEAELTPTMKLKRRVILEKFGKEIEEMYAGT